MLRIASAITDCLAALAARQGRHIAGVLLILSVCSPVAAQVSVEIRLADDTVLGAGSPPPNGRLPVLFVHGHKVSVLAEPEPNYFLNWQDPKDDTSVRDTLDLAANSGLDIEPYYINFTDHDRSILHDANAISFAVEAILKRHDPNYALTGTTAVQIAIVAYSKGTLSSRLYLKSLREQLTNLPADVTVLPAAENGLVPRPGFNPVSEFVAISPPNHGIRPPVIPPSSIAASQLYNGRSRVLCSAYSNFSGPWGHGLLYRAERLSAGGRCRCRCDRLGKGSAGQPPGWSPNS